MACAILAPPSHRTAQTTREPLPVPFVAWRGQKVTSKLMPAFRLIHSSRAWGVDALQPLLKGSSLESRKRVDARRADIAFSSAGLMLCERPRPLVAVDVGGALHEAAVLLWVHGCSCWGVPLALWTLAVAVSRCGVRGHSTGISRGTRVSECPSGCPCGKECYPVRTYVNPPGPEGQRDSGLAAGTIPSR